jgi:hypothetical protein
VTRLLFSRALDRDICLRATRRLVFVLSIGRPGFGYWRINPLAKLQHARLAQNAQLYCGLHLLDFHCRSCGGTGYPDPSVSCVSFKRGADPQRSRKCFPGPLVGAESFFCACSRIPKLSRPRSPEVVSKLPGTRGRGSRSQPTTRFFRPIDSTREQFRSLFRKPQGGPGHRTVHAGDGALAWTG